MLQKFVNKLIKILANSSVRKNKFSVGSSPRLVLKKLAFALLVEDAVPTFAAANHVVVRESFVLAATSTNVVHFETAKVICVSDASGPLAWNAKGGKLVDAVCRAAPTYLLKIHQ